ncbi:MAG TPA: type II CRISPR-associated endonuclease Cas1 [Bacteroidales bacterium]|nr:type II CRISPR-associated endonuclease Cas1 [Bacteroidales bacterium]HOR82369.1 type II CRISPR-associated endonuclease Cas1 [Bacteroidales bacterium]HPJ91069.1 type II CRISPR-associated endonuclease Cas1 [Bacteroidales bacterium]
MIKRTLYFGNPAYLSLKNEQLLIRLPEVEKNDTLPLSFKQKAETTIPIEDIGVAILDHQQITITQALLEKLLLNNVAVITCDSSHMPIGLVLPLAKNTVQSQLFASQINASEPLKKQLWQQTIEAKITNQAGVLQTKNIPIDNMLYWAKSVKSGDSEKHEARAAAYYWSRIFSDNIVRFKREREGAFPNNLLNYGYAVLRAVIARSLIGSGLLPTLGIHHHNKYNAYCLADDIMEPYRPYVDALVNQILIKYKGETELNKSIKQELLSIPVLDVVIKGERSPLMVGAQRTTASLARCIEGKLRKISYPRIEIK